MAEMIQFLVRILLPFFVETGYRLIPPVDCAKYSNRHLRYFQAVERMESDQDYSSESESDIASISSDEEVQPKKLRRKRTAPCTVETLREQVKRLEEELRDLSCRRKATMTVGEKLDIVILVKRLTLQHVQNCMKSGKNYGKPAIHGEVVKLLQRGKRDVASCVEEWNRARTMTANQCAANRTNHASRILNSKAVVAEVQEFLREAHTNSKVVTSNDILQHLLSLQVVEVDVLNSKAVQTAERNVRRWLHRNGFRIGTCGRRESTWLQDPAHLRKVDEYLMFMLENMSSATAFREVYLDESYIHHHYRKNAAHGWFASDDPSDKLPKGVHKGRRYCFIGAIIGPSRKELSVVGRNAFCCDSNARLLLPTVDVFEGKGTGDYHGRFTNAYFLKWWNEKLLPALPAEPCVLIMDNAKYHASLPDDTPNVNLMRKPDLVEYLHSVGISTDNLLLPQLRISARQHIRAVVKPAVVAAAEKLGHRVLFTPPRYSNLQPIELLWAKVKTGVAKVCEYFCNSCT